MTMLKASSMEVALPNWAKIHISSEIPLNIYCANHFNSRPSFVNINSNTLIKIKYKVKILFKGNCYKNRTQEFTPAHQNEGKHQQKGLWELKVNDGSKKRVTKLLLVLVVSLDSLESDASL